MVGYSSVPSHIKKNNDDDDEEEEMKDHLEKQENVEEEE